MKIKSSILFLSLITMFTTSYLSAVDNGGVWLTPPADVSTTVTGENQEAQVAFDCNGNAVCVWVLNQVINDTIYSARYNATAGSWGSPESLSTTITGNNQTPQVAIDCDGNAICVWRHRGDDDNIYSAYYTATTETWEDPKLVSAGLTGDQQNPQVAIDCYGNAICVWNDSTGIDQVYAAHYNATTEAWGDPRDLSVGIGDNSTKPQVAIDCNGNAICVWGDYDNVYAAYYTAATDTWGTYQTIAADIERNDIDQQVAIDCNGNAICVWWHCTDNTYEDCTAYAAHYTAATDTWGDPVPISTSHVEGPGKPQIVIDCNGNAICVWYDETSPDTVYAARYTAATETWGNPVPISASLEDDNQVPQVAIDCYGNAICVWWNEVAGETDHIYAARYNATTETWQTPEVISDGLTDRNQVPQIAIDCYGNAICVWENEVAGQTDHIYAAYFDAVPAPSNIRSGQELHRFATQGDLVDVLRWDPVSFQNSIVKYKIKCTPYVAQTPCCEDCCDCKIRCCTCPCTNATLIGEVPTSGQLVFNHHNRCYGQRTTYCLTAVDNAGNETPVPVSVTVPAV